MPGVRRLFLPASVGLDLVPGLRSLSRIRCLGLTQDYDDTAEQFLDEFARAEAGQAWLCPQLEELSLPHCDLRPSLRQAILRFARARGPRASAERKPPTQLRVVSFGSRDPPSDAQFSADLAAALEAA
ncbi:hypothetical protein AURDEDRAFT_115100 [Auricularia subglabra TFB-10046 SS5]|nr:hypothetical protein AURDEDRAFT_115100 [Auricularia subglabra TFB-10046 SS5]